MRAAAATRSMTRASSTGSIGPLTLGDLRRALDDKERELRDLLARKESLAEELEELGSMLEAMLAGGGVAPGRRPGPGRPPKATRAQPANGRRKPARAAREGSLPVVIRSVLERVVGPMRVGEIAEAVVKAGYATKSKNLNIIVANRLAQMDDIEKVERGLYQLKRADGGAPADAPAS
jgi:hypothetical protein